MTSHPVAAASSPSPSADWRATLEAAIEADPRGKAGVADTLGVSRGYVSQVLNGHRATVPANFIVRVVERLCATACPHLGRDIPHASCREYAARQWSAISQFEVDHWRACQRCTCRAPDPLPTPLKPKPEDWVFVPRPAPARRHRPHAAAAAVPTSTTAPASGHEGACA